MKEKIVFSLTCHENVDCVIDLIENIKKCFSNFLISILISCTNNIYNELYLIIEQKYNFCKIITVRDIRFSIWGNIHLLHQHMLNMKILIENNIKYDYFWFISSNEYFFKIVTPEHLKKYVISPKEPNHFTQQDISEYYDTLFNKHHEWVWYKHIQKDTYLLKKFKENFIKIYNSPHEGTVLPYHIVNELYSFYLSLDIINNSTYNDYVLEEIFMSSYINSKYKIKNYNTFCLHNIHTKYGYLNDTEYLQLLLKEPISVSAKPIKRDFNNTLRTMIRNSLLDY